MTEAAVIHIGPEIALDLPVVANAKAIAVKRR
jgi:hypothetical protein